MRHGPQPTCGARHRISAPSVDGWCKILPRGPSQGRDVAFPSRRFPPELHGKCLNCLSSSHRVVTCRLPHRCVHCKGFCHRARDCKLLQAYLGSPSRVATTHALRVTRRARLYLCRMRLGIVGVSVDIRYAETLATIEGGCSNGVPLRARPVVALAIVGSRTRHTQNLEGPDADGGCSLVCNSSMCNYTTSTMVAYPAQLATDMGHYGSARPLATYASGLGSLKTTKEPIDIVTCPVHLGS